MAQCCIQHSGCAEPAEARAYWCSFALNSRPARCVKPMPEQLMLCIHCSVWEMPGSYCFDALHEMHGSYALGVHPAEWC